MTTTSDEILVLTSFRLPASVLRQVDDAVAELRNRLGDPDLGTVTRSHVIRRAVRRYVGADDA